jgi:hypothetical protein
MVSIQTFKTWSLSFPGTSEEPHFEKTSFRVKKKIFATLDEKTMKAVLKLNSIDQEILSSLGKTVVYPVPNKWGLQGWTVFELEKAHPEMVQDALQLAYQCVLKKQK